MHLAWRLRSTLLVCCLLFLGLGCGEDADAGGAPMADAGAMADLGGSAPDLGSPDTGIAPPVLTPCPEGWEARADERLGLQLCEPWPGSSPVNWDCPIGWREVVEDGVATCDPYPEGGVSTCGRFEVHYPGAPDCSPIGATCPSGDFPEDLPADADVVYVKAGFRGGDGTSPASPLGSLYDVNFRALASGTIVALAKGTHRWTGVLSRSVTLWGACVAETTLTSPLPLPADAPLSILSVDTTGLAANREVTVKNLRVTSDSQVGFDVQNRLRLRLEGVLIDGTQLAGLAAALGGRLFASDLVVRQATGPGLELSTEARAELERVVFQGNRGGGIVALQSAQLALEDGVVRDSAGLDGARGFGIGLLVGEGSTVEARGLLVERNRNSGLSVGGEGTKVVLEDVVIRDTRGRLSDGRLGRGLEVRLGATVELRRALLTRNREVAIFAFDANTAVVIEDVAVVDTQGQGFDLGFGRGLELESGAEAQVRRAVFDRNRDTAVLVSPGSRLDMEDALVRATRSEEASGTRGRGLEVISGSAVVRRALFDRNREIGAFVGGENARLVLEDAVVRKAAAQDTAPNNGAGLQVQTGATAEVRRAVFDRNRVAGLVVGGADARLVVEDAVVRDTQSRASDQLLGRGLNVQEGATAEVRRVVLDRNRENGVFVARADSLLVLEDAVVRDTQSQMSDQDNGRGLNIQLGARAEVARAAFLDSREVGVYVGRGSTASLVETIIDGVRLPPCAEAASPCFSSASGIVSDGEDSAVVLDRTRVARSSQCGIFLVNGGALDGTEVVLTDNDVGGCFEDPLYDVARLGASFVDNGERLTFSDLPPAPEAVSD